MKKYFLIFYSDRPISVIAASKDELFRSCVEKLSEELKCFKVVSFFPNEIGDSAGEVTDYLEIDSCGNKTIAFYPRHNISENPPERQIFLAPKEAASFYVEKYFQSKVFEFEENENV